METKDEEKKENRTRIILPGKKKKAAKAPYSLGLPPPAN